MEPAVAGSAGAIVTHNIRDFKQSELLFSDIAILTPFQLLQEKKMTTAFTVRLPDEAHSRLREVAKQRQMSMNKLFEEMATINYRQTISPAVAPIQTARSRHKARYAATTVEAPIWLAIVPASSKTRPRPRGAAKIPPKARLHKIARRVVRGHALERGYSALVDWRVEELR